MRRRNPKTLWSLVVLAVLGILWMILSFRFHVSHLLTLSSIHQWSREVHSLGVWGPLASIAFMIVHSVTFVPAEFITVGNIVVFGPVLGVLYSWIGAMLGAYFSFFLARLLGYPMVHRFVSTRVLIRVDEFVTKKGVRGVLILRLIPLVSFNALNYATGLTEMSVWNFTWTTGLGILPMEILIALVYRSALDQKFAFTGLSIIGILWLALLFLKARMRKRRNHSETENDLP